MSDFFAGFPPGFLNGVGVVSVIVVLGFWVYRGRFVPDKFYNYVLARLAEERAEKEKWRQAYEDIKEAHLLLLRSRDPGAEALMALRDVAEQRVPAPKRSGATLDWSGETGSDSHDTTDG